MTISPIVELAGVRAGLHDAQPQHKSSPTARHAPLRSLHAPRLTPLTLAPRGSVSVGFLANIEQTRISTTASRDSDGITLYVVEVFQFCQRTSNIPTLRNKPNRDATVSSSLSPPRTQNSQSLGRLSDTADNDGSSTTSQTDEALGPTREPDLCVRHRFSDFARLRREALARTCMNAHFLCPYCRQFETYARFQLTQPLWIVRYGTTMKARKRILEQFLSDLIGLAQSQAHHAPRCVLREHLPRLIEAFLTPRATGPQ